MRTVADTNIVVSGLLWRGPSRHVLDRARAGEIQLFTSPALLVELEEVLSRRKFIRRFADEQLDLRKVLHAYAALARVIVPAETVSVVHDDPDDDEVLACALEARAEVIVSGDSHLVNLKWYRGIRIVRAADLLRE